MRSEWKEAQGVAVLDAMGEFVEGVESYREIDGGLEVVAIALSRDGETLVSSHDDGVTFDDVRCRMEIFGAQLVEV